jgi:hypothetical protein
MSVASILFGNIGDIYMVNVCVKELYIVDVCNLNSNFKDKCNTTFVHMWWFILYKCWNTLYTMFVCPLFSINKNEIYKSLCNEIGFCK